MDRGNYGWFITSDSDRVARCEMHWWTMHAKYNDKRWWLVSGDFCFRDERWVCKTWNGAWESRPRRGNQRLRQELQSMCSCRTMPQSSESQLHDTASRTKNPKERKINDYVWIIPLDVHNGHGQILISEKEFSETTIEWLQYIKNLTRNQSKRLTEQQWGESLHAVHDWWLFRLASKRPSVLLKRLSTDKSKMRKVFPLWTPYPEKLWGNSSGYLSSSSDSLVTKRQLTDNSAKRQWRYPKQGGGPGQTHHKNGDVYARQQGNL